MTASADLTALERHHLSEIWGDMEDPLFQSLVADVTEVGVREPITLYEGKVLDGWHRLRAAIQVGLADVGFITFAGDDPAGYVIRRNALRRPLSTQQRVAIVAMAREWQPLGANQHGWRVRNECGPSTAADIAREAGASVSLVEKVKTRIRAGHGADLATGKETLATLTRKERNTLAKKDAVTRPLTRMERLEAEVERLRMERDTALEKYRECEEARTP